MKTANRKRGGQVRSDWVGRGARRFDNRKNALRLYVGMGIATFLLTIPLLITADLQTTGDLPAWLVVGVFAIAFTLAELAGQALLFASAFVMAHANTVWMGENGIETRTFGIITNRMAWNQIRRVELYRLLGMRCVRVFQTGKRQPDYLPLYFSQTDAVFREAGDWLGYATMPMESHARLDVASESGAVTPAPLATPIVRETPAPTQSLRR